MDLAPDFDEFIGLLSAHGVEFLVVGAYALAFLLLSAPSDFPSGSCSRRI